MAKGLRLAIFSTCNLGWGHWVCKSETGWGNFGRNSFHSASQCKRSSARGDRGCGEQLEKERSKMISATQQHGSVSISFFLISISYLYFSSVFLFSISYLYFFSVSLCLSSKIYLNRIYSSCIRICQQTINLRKNIRNHLNNSLHVFSHAEQFLFTKSKDFPWK